MRYIAYGLGRSQGTRLVALIIERTPNATVTNTVHSCLQCRGATAVNVFNLSTVITVLSDARDFMERAAPRRSGIRFLGLRR